MEIKTDKIQVELDSFEASSLAYHIKHSLKQSILDHYISKHHDSYNRGIAHAKGLFEEQCRKDLNMMKLLIMMAHGRSGEWMEKELWDFLEKEYVKKHGSESPQDLIKQK